MEDEQQPQVLQAEEPFLVVWSSVWPTRPDARVRFDIAPDDSAGTQLVWTLQMTQPLPGASLLGHMRKRLNVLINESLRSALGQ